jgi:hypothetical protein
MAMVRKGAPLDGLSGRLGDLVFRTRGDRTIVSRRPRRRDPGAPRSEKLAQTLTRFQRAVRFARRARHQNAFRSLARTLRAYSPYHVALQDFLSEPVIESVDASDVSHRGGEIRIRVSERVAVRAVRVKMMPRSAEPSAPRATGREPVSIPAVSSPAAPEGDEDPQRPAVSTPAELFFKPAASRHAEPRADPGGDPRSADEFEERAGSTSGAPRELRATRHLGVARTPDEGHPAGRVEMWRVDLPRPGEIEIIAADYAGNRTTRTLLVGPVAGHGEL